MSLDPATGSDIIAKIMAAGSLVAGLGFLLGALWKFHQHKQNPQQGLTIESLTAPAGVLQLSGRRIDSYELGRTRGAFRVKVSATLPLSLPIATETGPATLVITSIRDGRGTLDSRFAE